MAVLWDILDIVKSFLMPAGPIPAVKNWLTLISIGRLTKYQSYLSCQLLCLFWISLRCTRTFDIPTHEVRVICDDHGRQCSQLGVLERLRLWRGHNLRVLDTRPLAQLKSKDESRNFFFFCVPVAAGRSLGRSISHIKFNVPDKPFSTEGLPYAC